MRDCYITINYDIKNGKNKQDYFQIETGRFRDQHFKISEINDKSYRIKNSLLMKMKIILNNFIL